MVLYYSRGQELCQGPLIPQTFDSSKFSYLNALRKSTRFFKNYCLRLWCANIIGLHLYMPFLYIFIDTYLKE